jgi:hypothetical protein
MLGSDTLRSALDLINETLTATVVMVSASILLYNLAQRTHDRVTRTSAIVLACVIATYLTDVFISLEPGNKYLETWLRVQWVGIAFVPAALLHLSDALLETTGRPSRGRRKAAIRASYAVSTAFLILAISSEVLITNPDPAGIPRMTAGPVFAAYVAYLLVIVLFSMVNVIRARRRCLTRYTRRRMTYLLSVFLSPVYGAFPYSLLFGRLGEERTTALLIILNLSNLIIMLMLIFMAYPLSFFGSAQPDRVIKARFMEFMLRGPLTGAAILAVILFVPRISNVLGLDGDALVPFAAVAVLLFLQWSITLLLPILERWLIYSRDQEQAQWIQRLGDRLLTQADASQLLESILATICDNLRVPTAFVARCESNGAQLFQVVGPLVPSPEALSAPELSLLATDHESPESTVSQKLRRMGEVFLWHSYWLVPLRQPSHAGNGTESPLLGILGIWARAPEPNFTPDEEKILRVLTRQATQILEDLQRQSEIFDVLEGLASQMDIMQQLRGVSRYGHVSSLPAASNELVTDPGFSDMVKDALRDYWGGPKLTESELLRLNVVWQEMESADDKNPVRALRAVLARAIENLKPQGERSLTTTEWIMYNILEMRFLQGRKVRDVAYRLAMSESDLYRKQRLAIEEVARQIADMENGQTQPPGSPVLPGE